MTNSFRLVAVVSLLAKGETQDAVRSRHTGLLRKKAVSPGRKQTEPGTARGGWRRNGRKVWSR